MPEEVDDVCPECGHSLKDNKHEPDQNDFEYDSPSGKAVYLGSCTYCKVCRGEAK